MLYKPHVDDQYASLNAEVRHIKAASKEFKDVAKQVQASQLNSHGSEVVDIKNIFSVRREEELKQFTDSIPNQRTLFHGSRISNWVGLLGRGILLPKVCVGFQTRGLSSYSCLPLSVISLHNWLCALNSAEGSFV